MHSPATAIRYLATNCGALGFPAANEHARAVRIRGSRISEQEGCVIQHQPTVPRLDIQTNKMKLRQQKGRNEA